MIDVNDERLVNAVQSGLSYSHTVEHARAMGSKSNVTDIDIANYLVGWYSELFEGFADFASVARFVQIKIEWYPWDVYCSLDKVAHAIGYDFIEQFEVDGGIWFTNAAIAGFLVVFPTFNWEITTDGHF